MKAAPVLLLLLSGCAEIQAARMAGREAIEALNDQAMDDARKLVCNNFYSAEQRFLDRTGVSPEGFRAFCGRGDKSVR